MARTTQRTKRSKTSPMLKNKNIMLKVRISHREVSVSSLLTLVVFISVACLVINRTLKLVEENVYAKPMDGPSSGHREEKKEQEKPEEKEATSSGGRTLTLLCVCCDRWAYQITAIIYDRNRSRSFNPKSDRKSSHQVVKSIRPLVRSFVAMNEVLFTLFTPAIFHFHLSRTHNALAARVAMMTSWEYCGGESAAQME